MKHQELAVYGSQFGVELRPRTKEVDGTDSPLLILFVEDDENWHEKVSFDAYWLDDLISVLRNMRREIKEQP